jgi:hypothetical protein
MSNISGTWWCILVLGFDDPISKLSLYIGILGYIQRDPQVGTTAMDMGSREKGYQVSDLLKFRSTHSPILTLSQGPCLLLPVLKAEAKRPTTAILIAHSMRGANQLSEITPDCRKGT